jgi:hypothetical protein
MFIVVFPSREISFSAVRLAEEEYAKDISINLEGPDVLPTTSGFSKPWTGRKFDSFDLESVLGEITLICALEGCVVNGEGWNEQGGCVAIPAEVEAPVGRYGRGNPRLLHKSRPWSSGHARSQVTVGFWAARGDTRWTYKCCLYFKPVLHTWKVPGNTRYRNLIN